jgi:serine/threonine protein kinase
MPLVEGDRLGQFEILGHIGQGGMGDVYKALDTRLNRVVATIQLEPKFAAGSPHHELFKGKAPTRSLRDFPYQASADGQKFLCGKAPAQETAGRATVILNWKP